MAVSNASLSVDLSDAPGGDLSLDDIFGDDSQQTTTAVSTESQTTSTNESEPFLKTATGTVYKSVEDAVKGVEHKDALIAQLRQELSDKTGRDPLKRETVTNGGPKNYLEDKDTYFKDLSSAVEAKDPEKYMEVQSKFVMDTLAPLAPTMSAFVRSQAIESVEQEIPDFRKFTQSEDYGKTLESYPLLKQAIGAAESNPQLGAQLSEFYKLAYHVHNGVRLPEIVQQTKNGGVAQNTRPTVTSTTVQPPASSQGSVVSKPTLETKEGRKALIEQQERLGIQDLRF